MRMDTDTSSCCSSDVKDRCCMVTVLVDNNQIAFNVHMKTLVRKSSYFRKSLAAHQWMDDKVALIKLPHVSAFCFKHYSHWINQDRLHFEAFDYSLDRYPPFLSIIRAARLAGVPVNRKMAKEAYGLLITRLVDIWTLAVQLGDIELQNTISDELATFLDHGWLLSPGKNALTAIETYSRPGSPLCRLCIEWADDLPARRQLCTNSMPKWLTTGLLLLRMRRAGGELKDDPRDTPNKKGRYHVRQQVVET